MQKQKEDYSKLMESYTACYSHNIQLDKQNKSLQSELRLANKMIKLMAYEMVDKYSYLEKIKRIAISELGE